MKKIGAALLTILLLGLLGCGLLVASGFALSAPVHRMIGPPPPDLQAESVEFASVSGNRLSGWIAQGVPGRGFVVLLHGIYADRRAHLARMRLLQQAGYGVLAIDFQAHGESSGDRITLGHLEALDAAAAVDYVRKRYPGERIGVIGVSLGGAAVLLGPRPLAVDAIVLESVYPDIDHALCNRFVAYLGRAGCLLTPIFTALMPTVLGIHATDLRPIDHIGQITAPVLILAGTADDRTSITETRDLFARAASPKELWEVPGAGHVDLLNYAPDAYPGHVLPFLERYLRPSGLGAKPAINR